MADLALSVVLQAIDRLSKPLSVVQRATVATTKITSAAQKQIAALGQNAYLERMRDRLSAVNRQLSDNASRLRVVAGLEERRKANDEKMAKLRGKVVSTAAMAASVVAPIVTAAHTEQSEARLRNSINAEPGQAAAAMAAARAEARVQAQKGLVGMTDAFDIQDTLSSSGLDASAARAATDIVAKLSKVTNAVPTAAAEILGGTYKNLADTLEGTTDDKLKSIGDILAATQAKYKFADFSQLGEGIAKSAAAAARGKVPLTQLATAIGILNDAQITAGSAGAAFNAVERNLYKASQDLGFQIVRTADGQMDFVATLEDLDRAMTFYDDIDERNQVLRSSFGDAGQAALVPWLENLKKMKDESDGAAKSFNGFLDSKAAVLSSTTAAEFSKLTGSVYTLADSVGRALLPAVNAILSPIASAVAMAADLAEKFPRVTAVTGSVVVGLVAVRAAMIALAIGKLFFANSILGAVAAVVKLYGVLPMVIGGIRAVGLAMAANPIGAAVTAIVLAAGLIYENWEPIRDFFLSIWDAVEPYWEKFAGFISDIWDKISAPFLWLAKFMPGGVAVNAESSLVGSGAAATSAEIAPSAARNIVGSAAPAAAASSGGSNSTTTVSNSIVVQPSAGMDEAAIAAEVKRLLDRDQREALND